MLGGSISKTKLDTLRCLNSMTHSIMEIARINDKCKSNGPTVENLIPFERSVMAYKILNKWCPSHLWDKKQYRSTLSNYDTRNSKDLQIPRLITEHAKKGFCYCALKAWNDIPTNIREIKHSGASKEELKAHLMN